MPRFSGLSKPRVQLRTPRGNQTECETARKDNDKGDIGFDEGGNTKPVVDRAPLHRTGGFDFPRVA